MDKGTKALYQRVANLEKAVQQLKRLSNTPSKEHIEAAAEQSGHHQDYRADLTTTAEANLILSETAKSEQRWYSPARWRNIVRRILAWKLFNRIGVAAGIGYAIITALQWHDLRRNFEVDQRAWIKISTVLPDAISPPAEAVIIVENIGKSPALQSVVHTEFEIVDSNKPPSFIFTSRHYATTFGILYPSDKMSVNVSPTPTNPDGSDRILTEGEIDRLKTGTAYIAIFGQAFYRDQFGDHWGRYCAWKAYAQKGPTSNPTFHAGACISWQKVGEGIHSL